MDVLLEGSTGHDAVLVMLEIISEWWILAGDCAWISRVVCRCVDDKQKVVEKHPGATTVVLIILSFFSHSACFKSCSHDS